MASAAVGPVTAGPLREAGIDPVVPDRHRLGALVRLVTEELSQRRIQRLRSNGVIIELRGRQVSVNDRRISLGPNWLALLVALASSNSVLSRQELIACLPDNPDEHALHMAMSRLRRALEVPGLITTIMKRGYRFNAGAEWFELLHVVPRVDQPHRPVCEVALITDFDEEPTTSCNASNLYVRGSSRSRARSLVATSGP